MATTLNRSLTWEALVAAAQNGCAVLMLGKRGFTLIDEDRYDELSAVKWFRHPGGYVVRSIWLSADRCQTPVYLHRVVAAAPVGFQVDHRNHVKSDNRLQNLRICTQEQNKVHLQKQRGRYKFKGARQRPSGRWEAFANKHYLGTYATEHEAAAAYNKFALEHHGEFACLNQL